MNLEFIKGEYDGNRINLIRETIQRKRPFVIYTFTNTRSYRQMLTDLSNFGKLKYVKQVFLADPSLTRFPILYPSLFVTNHETEIDNDEFKKMALGSLKQYGLDSIICLYNGAVSAYYRNGENHSIGNDIHTSLDPKTFLTYCFQLESTYYTFV